MEPEKDEESMLEDVVNDLLDKGSIFHADLIITVAGVPLVGLNLKAAVAGIETMLDHGVMEPWTESMRKYYEKEIAPKTAVPFLEDEHVVYEVFGSYWQDGGVYSPWKYGTIYLTNKRLFLFRKCPPTVLFETELDKIKGFGVTRKKRAGKEQENILVEVEGKGSVLFHTTDMNELKNALMRETRLPLSA